MRENDNNSTIAVNAYKYNKPTQVLVHDANAPNSNPNVSDKWMMAAHKFDIQCFSKIYIIYNVIIRVVPYRFCDQRLE
jgi:hypothetical protein